MTKTAKFKELYKHIFGEDYQEDKYKLIPHSFSGKIVGKTYCVKCGLVALRNSFSQWAVKNGCLHEAHSSYKQQRRKVKTI